MKRIVCFILIAIMVSGGLSVDTFCVQTDIGDSEDILRFHVRANSGSEADLRLKLAVRDELLFLTDTLLHGVSDKECAERILRSNIRVIKAAADGVLKRGGARYRSSVSLTREYFLERDYTLFTLPEGEYDSLTVTLGAGKGENWWCVLFPTVCTAGCVEIDEAASEGDSAVSVKVDLFLFRILKKAWSGIKSVF